MNGQIRYSVVSGDPNRDFAIGEDSGILRVSKTLNFERKRSYTLTVHAEDSGEEVKVQTLKPSIPDLAGLEHYLHKYDNQQVRYDTASVIISVENINDNPPLFLDSPYLAYVRENLMDLPTSVLKVSAYDADASPSQQIRYLMKDGDKGTFRVNATTGEVTVHRTLDREQQSEYHLVVVAMDTGLSFSFFFFPFLMMKSGDWDLGYWE